MEGDGEAGAASPLQRRISRHAGRRHRPRRQRAAADHLSHLHDARAPPPLVAEDGFESLPDDDADAGAQALSGWARRRLRARAACTFRRRRRLEGGSRRSRWRLPILSGDTVLHFAYLSVNPEDAFGVYFVVASVGGTIGTVTLPPDGAGATTPATIGGTPVLLGPLMTATIGLPGDAHGEVVLARLAAESYSCGGPAPPPCRGRSSTISTPNDDVRGTNRDISIGCLPGVRGRGGDRGEIMASRGTEVAQLTGRTHRDELEGSTSAGDLRGGRRLARRRL